MGKIFQDSMWPTTVACERCGRPRSGSKHSRLCRDCQSVEPDWPFSVDIAELPDERD